MNLSKESTIQSYWKSIQSNIIEWGDCEDKSKLLSYLSEAIQLEAGKDYENCMKVIYEKFVDFYRGRIIKNGGIITDLDKIQSALD